MCVLVYWPSCTRAWMDVSSGLCHLRVLVYWPSCLDGCVSHLLSGGLAHVLYNIACPCAGCRSHCAHVECYSLVTIAWCVFVHMLVLVSLSSSVSLDHTCTSIFFQVVIPLTITYNKLKNRCGDTGSST